jgi:hypothetical protein
MGSSLQLYDDLDIRSNISFWIFLLNWLFQTYSSYCRAGEYSNEWWHITCTFISPFLT